MQQYILQETHHQTIVKAIKLKDALAMVIDKLSIAT
jgi:hypothetical protein